MKSTGKKRGGDVGFTRFFVNVGRMDDIKPNTLMGLINEFTGISDIEIGKIEILKSFSFFEVDEDFASTVLKAFDGKEYRGRKISAEVAESQGRSGGGDRGRGREKSYGRDRERGGDRGRGKEKKYGRDRERGGDRKKSYDKKPFEKKSFDKKFDRKDKKEGDRKSFGDKPKFGEGRKRKRS
jgi:ATP-dependent RNA helicase DeaD